MPQKSITFNCEIVTPMFCGNATQDAELRPSAIKGALRFWWRAMQNSTDVAKVREEEANIFGSASEEVGRSKVIIEIEKETVFQSEIPNFLQTEQGNTKPLFKYYDTGKRHTSNILDYLAYGLNDYDKNQGRVVYHRDCFMPGEKFKVIIKSSDEGHEAKLKEVFRVFARFGGMGAKTRNGYGQFRILNGVAENNVLNLPNADNAKQSFTAFSKASKVFVKSSQNHTTWDEALSEIGWAYRESRLEMEGKYDHYTYGKRIYVAQPIVVKGKVTPSFLERHSKSYFLFVDKLGENKYRSGILYLPYNYLKHCDNYSKMDEEVKSQQANHRNKYNSVCAEINSKLTQKLK